MLEAYVDTSKLSTWVEGGHVACQAAWKITKEENEPPPLRASAWQIGSGGGLTKESREGAWARGVVRVFSPV